MKSFNQFITEGRDAPLYHGTSVRDAVNILEDNILRVNNVVGDEFIYSASKQHPFNGMKGISLSRQIKFSASWKHPNIVFEFDQSKLTQSHKISAFNYFADVTRREMPSHKKHYHDDYDFDVFSNQYEETVVKDIAPLHKYLTKVILYDAECVQNIQKLMEKDKEFYKTIWEHPLLYFWHEKRFINK